VLYAILKMLVSEREAGLIAQLPPKHFTADKVAQIWKMNLVDAQKVLEELANRAVLVDIQDSRGRQVYVLPPPLAGFFEFSMMRIRSDVDQKVLGELYQQYLTVEEDFMKQLFIHGGTQQSRVFVQEAVLPQPQDNAVLILDYERAGEVVKTATYRGVGLCFCRHKTEHVGRDCDAPKNMCLTFNRPTASLIKHRVAREMDAAERLDILQQSQEYNLVQCGENVHQKVSFLCNCCGCCCEALAAVRRFAWLNPIHTTNYISHLQLEEGNGCGKCVNVCPVEAMTLVLANNPYKPKRKKAWLNEDICLGCGMCVNSCPQGSIRLESRPERVITPLNTAHRTVVMAIERGMLPNLIFNNNAQASHRAMAAILGVILKLSPIKQAMASRQMKSRYLESLLSWYAS